MKVFGVVTSLVLTAAIAVACSAQAMEIQQFDRMAVEDQSDYIVGLIEGAQQVLIHVGRRDLADKVHTLFVTILPGDKSPVGAVEFESNLNRARLADIRNLEKDPHAQRLEVEDAMAVTLKKNGIELPDSFFTVNANFRPKHPPKP